MIWNFLKGNNKQVDKNTELDDAIERAKQEADEYESLEEACKGLTPKAAERLRRFAGQKQKEKL